MLECRKAALRREIKKFFMDVVFRDFTTEDCDHLDDELADAKVSSEYRIFCDYLELGDYFINLLREIDFDLTDLLIDLRSECEEADRDATEEYEERQREYREMVLPKGGGMS